MSPTLAGVRSKDPDYELYDEDITLGGPSIKFKRFDDIFRRRGWRARELVSQDDRASRLVEMASSSQPEFKDGFMLIPAREVISDSRVIPDSYVLYRYVKTFN